MKRELLKNVKVMPYTLETAIDREGFLSAVFAVAVTAGETVTIAVTDCDTKDGSYAAVTDKMLVIDGKSTQSVSGTVLVNFDLDLLGCKRYIKINVTGGATATYAVVLGDGEYTPAASNGSSENAFIRVGTAKVGESVI